jgi:uncharacterized protein (TIGR03083 family)
LRIIDLVASLDADALTTVVPACPAWTVHDVVAHLAGVVSDFQAGRMEGAATEVWTGRQVDERRATSTDDVLREWTDAAPAFEVVVTGTPGLRNVVMDVLTHEWDLRGALGRPGDRDDEDIDALVQQLMARLGGALERAGTPALRIRAGTDEWLLGPDASEPATTLTTTHYELLRIAFGRRSLAQLHALDWDGEPEPYLAALTIFPPSTTDLVE